MPDLYPQAARADTTTVEVSRSSARGCHRPADETGLRDVDRPRANCRIPVHAARCGDVTGQLDQPPFVGNKSLQLPLP
jgi:hypothetical protein